MPRRQFIAGNWKMNLDRARAVRLAEEVAKKAGAIEGVDLAVIPPSVYVEAIAKVLSGTKVAWGVQNAYWQPNGAFTGEVSVAMAQDLKCRYVVIGHSERRHILGESDEDVNNKVLAVLAGGLIPIVCVGETEKERDQERTFIVVERQTVAALASVPAEQAVGVVIAYEPVWAIGTGKTATPEQAQQVHHALRKILERRYNREVAEAIRIQYGGSVKPENAKDLLSQPDIDGALVGGASLDADQFMGIVAKARR